MGQDGDQAGEQGEQCRGAGNGDGQARHPAHAAEIDRRKQHHQRDGQHRDGHRVQIPLIEGSRRQDGGQPTGGHPPPPVTHAGEVGQHRTVGAKRFRTGGSDAAHAMGPHQDQFGPPRCGGPTEQ